PTNESARRLSMGTAKIGTSSRIANMPNDPNLFAIVPTTLPAPADAIVVGPMSEVMEYIPQTIARDNAMAELERARLSAEQIKTAQNKTRDIQLSMLHDAITHLSTRMDAFVERCQAQARRDAEEAEREEAERIQAELDALYYLRTTSCGKFRSGN